MKKGYLRVCPALGEVLRHRQHLPESSFGEAGSDVCSRHGGLIDVRIVVGVDIGDVIVLVLVVNENKLPLRYFTSV